MKKIFEKPIVEIYLLDVEDVITASEDEFVTDEVTPPGEGDNGTVWG